MPTRLPIYLHTLRKRSGFTQRELAFLLSISPEVLCKLEQLERQPTAWVIIGADIIFDASPASVFPSYYEKVETKVMRQASLLFERLEDKRDQESKEKCRRLLEMIKREEPADTTL
jgi:transcriptional regulator with XRE-family HTH domain